ncbi:phage baseplate assembly protein V [Streptomyces sp. NPDC004528]|uniref:phage baseplate assembly protein V n=1 Tax=Streptomyces sp. NPDC004528 TaxID=3154550 RepID=UPI0033A9E737
MTLTTARTDVYAAVVTHAQDPEGRGRVRLRIPQVSGNAITSWAFPTGTIGRRAVVGERVWAAFEGGGSRLVYWTAEPGLVTGAQIADGTIAQTHLAPQALDGMTVSADDPILGSDHWIDPVLGAGWATTTAFGGTTGVQAIQYRRDSWGSLHICGAITVTDPAAASTAFTVPIGYYNPNYRVGYPVVEQKTDGTFITSWGYVNNAGAVHFDKPAGFTRNAGDAFYVNARAHLGIIT